VATLQRAGLVTSRRMGQWTHHRRDEEALARLAQHLHPGG
jgi:ArsR family transcriptional regulator